jgi:sugar phosphate isomerase/epimerase
MEVHPRVSVNSVSAWSWSLRQNLEFWTSQGIGRVGMRTQTVTDDPDGVAAVRESGVTVDNLVYGLAFTLGDASRRDAERDNVRSQIDLAAELEARVLYLTTGPSLKSMTVDESIDDFCRAVEPLVATAAAAGVGLAVEQNHASTHDVGCIHTFRDLQMVAERTGLMMIAELQNCWVEYGIGAMLAESAAEIALVQVSDYVVGTTQRTARVCPGDGDLPLGSMIEAVLAGGYAESFDIEVLGPAIDELGYPAAIERSVRWLNAQLDALDIEGPPVDSRSGGR